MPSLQDMQEAFELLSPTPTCPPPPLPPQRTLLILQKMRMRRIQKKTAMTPVPMRMTISTLVLSSEPVGGGGQRWDQEDAHSPLSAPAWPTLAMCPRTQEAAGVGGDETVHSPHTELSTGAAVRALGMVQHLVSEPRLHVCGEHGSATQWHARSLSS